MKVSEAIEILSKLKEDFGDINVNVGASQNGRTLIINELFEILYNLTQNTIELNGEIEQ